MINSSIEIWAKLYRFIKTYGQICALNSRDKSYSEKLTVNRQNDLKFNRQPSKRLIFNRQPSKGLPHWDPRSIALRIPTAHDFRVISARTWARAHTKRKRFPSN